MAVDQKQDWQFGLYTHPGTIKDENQDRILLRTGEIEETGAALAIVADGMGGHSAGSMASSTAVEMFADWWEEYLHTPVRDREPLLVKSDVSNIMHQVNQHLLDYGRQNNVTTGTTLSLLYFYGRRFLIAHVGDSRIYKYKYARAGEKPREVGQLDNGDEPTASLDGKLDNNSPEGLQQLTEDQSWVAVQVKQGLMSKEEARLHPRRNLLLNCLGVDEKLHIFFNYGTFQAGDLFLLCSDGYYSMFADEEIREDLHALLKSGGSYQSSCEYLVDRALQRKAYDNVSVILLSPASSNRGPLKRLWEKLKIGRLQV